MLASLALLFASVSRVQAQYTVVNGSSYLNVYFNDGATPTPNIYGTDPYFPFNTSGGEATTLFSYGPASWLVTGSAPPASPGPLQPLFNVFDSGLQTFANAKARVYYEQNNLFFGTNNVSQSQPTITPWGTWLYLENTAATGIAELRIDWSATYNYSGVSYYPAWSAGHLYSVGDTISDPNGNIQQCISGGTSGGGPTWKTTLLAVTTDGTGGVFWQLQGANAPTFLTLGFQGTVNQFSAMAGEETFTIYTGPNAGTPVLQGPLMVSIPNGGDASFTSTPPSALTTFAHNGTFWGYSTPGSFGGGGTMPPFNLLPIVAGNSITVSGFLDVFVDPGSIQVSIAPPLGIRQTGSQAIVYWPAGLTNFVLESTPSLNPSNWTTNNSTVTTLNGTNSITVNPTGTAMFYRLKQ